MTTPNLVLEALKHTTTLACVTTRSLGLTRIDRNASEKVNIDNGAISRAASVNVNRLAGADAHHKEITSIQNKATTMLKQMSQPFGEEDKWRLLPNACFEKFIRALGPIKQEYDAALERLRENAQDIIDTAKANVGNFEIKVPTIEEMLEAYEMRTDFRPIPEGANFRGLDENTINKLRQRHDAQLEAAVHIAEKNTLERFVDPLERFVERMKAYDEKELVGDSKKRTGVFRDSVITNIKDLHEVVKDFNITGNPKLAQLDIDLADLVSIKPDTLRESEMVRTKATTRAQEVLDNLKAWGA